MHITYEMMKLAVDTMFESKIEKRDDGINIVLDLFLNASSKNNEIIKKLSKPEIQKGYDFIISSNGVSKDEYANKFGLTVFTAKRQLKEMVDLGLVDMVGRSVKTKYVKK